MSVIEKLDSVLALVSEAAPGEWSPHPTMDYSICLQDGSFIDITRHRAFGEVAERDAIIATLNLLRDHGSAIRQAVIDAEKWRWWRHKLTCGNLSLDEEISIVGAKSPEELDAAIDARLASDSEGPEADSGGDRG